MDVTPATPASRIAAIGAPLRLADGREVRIRFDLAALRRLEDAYGSIHAATEAWAGIFANATHSAAPWAGELLDLLALVLPDVDLATIDERPLDIVGLVTSAWLEAFPPPDPKGLAA